MLSGSITLWSDCYNAGDSDNHNLAKEVKLEERTGNEVREFTSGFLLLCVCIIRNISNLHLICFKSST